MIRLSHGSTFATVNPQGAWVEELSDNNQPILYSKTELMSDSGEKKGRGGMHVCLPNFGPGGVSSQPQHGFGRTSIWEVVSQSNSAVELSVNGPAPQYARLHANLNYELRDSSLISTLTLRNTGQTSLRVAPGFHPYFHLDEAETAVAINGTVYELDALGGTEFVQADSLSLQTANRTLSLAQENLSTWAVWTDCLANYVCAEPTYGGYRFLEASNPDEHLVPGSEKVFHFSISWQ